MTPKRKVWWDSLPMEEKRIRTSIKWYKQIIAYVKALFEDEITCDIDYEKKVMREAKRAIKALRKQIAMCPQINHLSDVLTRQPQLKCPCCSHRFVRHAPYCLVCGQKLRWK